jgi:hypothetical protein
MRSGVLHPHRVAVVAMGCVLLLFSSTVQHSSSLATHRPESDQFDFVTNCQCCYSFLGAMASICMGIAYSVGKALLLRIAPPQGWLVLVR